MNQALAKTKEPLTTERIVAQAAGTEAHSEATTIEQSRAIAEVQGAIVMARGRPRDVTSAASKILESCKMKELAERAFFAYARGGSTIQGPSIHLAVELARCWGNIDYGIKELDRNERERKSEMLAFAWDLETNTRVETTFIVPHKRDKRGGPVDLIDLRDIYENNANHAARRLREQIFRVLPPWLIEQAKDACRKTLQEGGDRPIEERRTNAITKFEEMGISREQVEAHIGKTVDQLTPVDLGALKVLLKSLITGEITIREAFGESDEPRGAAARAVTKDLKDKKDAGKKARPANEDATDEAESQESEARAEAEALADEAQEQSAVDKILGAISEAKSEDELTAIENDFADEIEGLSRGETADVMNAFNERDVEIKKAKTKEGRAE